MSEQNPEPRPFDPPTAPPAAPTPPESPTVPPVPPAPPVPDRPVPQYGEYAPAGYVSPVTPPAPAPAVANPYGVPGYAAPATPSNMYSAPRSGTVTASVAPVARTRRTWDLVLTIILLVLGLFGAGLGLVYAAIFSSPEVLSQVMSSQGYGTFSGTAGAAPAIIAVSHVALFVVALGLSIPLLIRGRMVVFWIPLAAGVIAAIIFWSCLITVFLSDPSFVARYGG